MSNIFIIGIEHSCQYNNKSFGYQEYKNLLSNQLRTRTVDIIFEEWNIEANRINTIEQTITNVIATQFHVPYASIDPLSITRKFLGIPTSAELIEKYKFKLTASKFERAVLTSYISKLHQSYYYLREAFWIKRIKEVQFSNALFIFGSFHIPEVIKILEKDYNIIILKRF